MAANDVSLRRDRFARNEIADGAADLIDDADEFVSDDHGDGDRLLSPRVPVIDVDVGPADRSLLDPDENIVRSHFGDRHFFQAKSRFGPPFYECLHRFAHAGENR